MQAKRSRELPLVPPEVVPNVIRTGDPVRVKQPGNRKFVGRFVGWGVDSITGEGLLFVQAPNGGVGPFVANETRLERDGDHA